MNISDIFDFHRQKVFFDDSSKRRYLIFALDQVSLYHKDEKILSHERVEEGVVIVPEPEIRPHRPVFFENMAIMDLKFPWSIKFNGNESGEGKYMGFILPRFIEYFLLPHAHICDNVGNGPKRVTFYTGCDGGKASLHCKEPGVEPEYAAKLMERYNTAEKRF